MSAGEHAQRDRELLAMAFCGILTTARTGRGVLTASPAMLARMGPVALARIGLLHLMQIYTDGP